MGSVYPRGNKLWVAFKDENGKRRLEPTGLPVGQEAKARKILEAVVDEHIASNPCALKKGELPKKIDKDPTWRGKAVFTREEVEQLISDERVPEENRVVYAILLFTGMRIGELASRKWHEYDPKAEPIGRLVVPDSWSRQQKIIKGTKTEVPREVPIHPTLAKVLAHWKLSGFERCMGRTPKPEDLIIPSPTGQYLDDTVVLDRLLVDLEALGLRRRTTHNMRRTFISIARAHGANKDVIKSMTHGAKGDQVDEYTTFDWPTLCEAILKIRISLREGKLLSLPLAADASEGASGDLLQPLLQSKKQTRKLERESIVMTTQQQCTRGESNPHEKSGLALFGAVSDANSGVSNPANAVTSGLATEHCSNVAIELTSAEVALLRRALEVGLEATGSVLLRDALALLRSK